jgi:hypothetical protein
MKLLLLLCILISVNACPSKQDTLNCIMKYDMDADGSISADEVYSVCDAKMYWYEKIVYSPQWITNKFREDCGFPLTSSSIKKKSCFEKCSYRTSIVHKLCSKI